jgi:type IV pilus assembly protein PilM
MSLLKQETNYFGLDIGATAIRLVQLKGSGGRPVLVTYGEVTVPVGLTASDSSLDRNKIAEHIRELVRETRVSTNHVVVGLPSASVFASVITTPKLTPTELSKAIKYQADQYVPMSLDEVKLDWAILGQGKTEDEMEVLLVAAPNSAANKCLDIMEKAGLEIVALEANALAVCRALLPPTEAAAVILDMSTFSSDLTVVYRNSPRLVRSVSIGVQTLVKAVAQNLGLDDAQAEQFTYRFGLTSTKLEGQVLKAVKPSLDGLVTEIEKSVKFFTGKYAEVKPEKLIVTGLGVAMPELVTYLANSTGLPVEVGNAWVNVSYPASQQEKLLSVSSQYAAASGLAQRMFVT